METDPDIGSPVFIGGYPKSGTTLLCSLLDGHKELVVIPEETKYFKRRRSRIANSDYISRFLEEFSAGFGKTIHASSGFRDYRDIKSETILEAAKRYWKTSDRSEKRVLESIAYGIYEALGYSGRRRYWVEKTPRNEANFQLISTWWPDAKLIVVVRDPRQALASHRRYQVKRNVNRPKPLGNFISDWNASNQNFKDAKYSGLDSCLLRYEDLVAGKEKVMKNVADFLGINFTPDLIKPTKAGLTWSGNSSSGAGSIGGYVPREIVENVKLRTTERRLIEYALGSVMTEWGYDTEIPWLHLPMWMLHGKTMALVELIGNKIGPE
jgi:protein-tyrosine sulfotransferase